MKSDHNCRLMALNSEDMIGAESIGVPIKKII